MDTWIREGLIHQMGVAVAVVLLLQSTSGFTLMGHAEHFLTKQDTHPTVHTLWFTSRKISWCVISLHHTQHGLNTTCEV